MKKTLLLFLVSLNVQLFAIDHTTTITSGSISRGFVFHSNATTLATIPLNLPLFIVMHGDGGNGAGMKSGTNFDAVANANNFIVVYPNAVNGSWNRYIDNVAGDAGLGNPNAPDDVAFISDLIDYFCTTYKINRNKVYATGHSAGGFMAYNLGLQLQNKIAAIAPVAGSLWGENTFVTQKFTTGYVPIPVYHVHGDADNTVTYPDTNHTPVAWQEWPLSGFSNANCGTNTYNTTTTTITPNVKQLDFCATNKKVQLIRIIGGGHNWPNVAGYDCATAISQFCLAYSLNIPGSCAPALSNNDFDLSNDKIAIYPNPSNGNFEIQTLENYKEIQVFDISGKQIKAAINQNSISLNAQSGIYILKCTFENGSILHKKLIIK
jgi:poly(3-hydroxybutyrate) depolymerase